MSAASIGSARRWQAVECVKSSSVPEAPPPKHVADLKISELQAEIAGLRKEVMDLKRDNALVNVSRHVLENKLKIQVKSNLLLAENSKKLSEFQSQIVTEIAQEIPGILDKMDGNTPHDKLMMLARMMPQILRINRKGSLSCILNDQDTGDKIRVGVNIKNGGNHITISARGTGKDVKLRGTENAIEYPIGFLTLLHGDVVLHFYQQKAPTHMTTIPIASCVNLGNANDGE